MVNLTGFVPGTKCVILRLFIDTILTPGRDFFSLQTAEFSDTTIRQLKAECFLLPRNRDLPEGIFTMLVDLLRSSSNPNESSVFLNSAVFDIFSKSFEITIGKSMIFPTL